MDPNKTNKRGTLDFGSVTFVGSAKPHYVRVERGECVKIRENFTIKIFIDIGTVLNHHCQHQIQEILEYILHHVTMYRVASLEWWRDVSKGHLKII